MKKFLYISSGFVIAILAYNVVILILSLILNNGIFFFTFTSIGCVATFYYVLHFAFKLNYEDKYLKTLFKVVYIFMWILIAVYIVTTITMPSFQNAVFSLVFLPFVTIYMTFMWIFKYIKPKKKVKIETNKELEDKENKQ